MREQGIPAPRAVWDAANTFRDLLAGAGGYVGARARATSKSAQPDRRGAARRTSTGHPEPGHPFVLVAATSPRRTPPASTPTRVLAIVTAEGGPTSHTAILARALGIPAVVACPEVPAIARGHRPRARRDHRHVERPPTGNRTAARERAARAAARNRRWAGPGATADGRRVTLLANVGDARGAAQPRPLRGRGRRPVPHRVPVPRPAARPARASSRPAYRRRFETFGTGEGRRPDARRRGGQAAAVPRAAGEEPNPALGRPRPAALRRQPEVLDRS